MKKKKEKIAEDIESLQEENLEKEIEEIIEEKKIQEIEDPMILSEEEIEYTIKDKDEKSYESKGGEKKKNSLYGINEENKIIEKEPKIKELAEQIHKPQEKSYLEVDELILRKKGYQDFMDQPGGYKLKLVGELEKMNEEKNKKTYEELQKKMYKKDDDEEEK